MRIDSSGRLLVGTTTEGSSSADDLTVATSAETGITIRSGTSSNGNIFFSDGTSGDSEYRGFITYAHNDDSLSFATTNDERMRIDSSGRLLVGTSTAVNSGYTGGSIQLRDNAGGTVVFKRNDGTDTNGLGILEFHSSFGRAALIEVANDGTHSGSSTPGAIKFQTTPAGTFGSPTERMRIASNGTSFFASTENVIGAMSEASAGTSIRLYYGSYSSTGISGTVSYTVWTNGNVVNANNSYGSLSDAKLKENIVDANSQWDDLKAIRVRNYNFIEGQTHTQIGVVAQEVETVSPGLVSESPDLDAEGNDLGTVTKSVNYSVLYMKAVKALQEAMERIETLEQRLSDAGIA